MAVSEITLKVDNNVTYIVGKLDSSTYQQLRKHLGYIPEDSFWMLKKSTQESKEGWKKDWDGRISTVHYSKEHCRCFEKKTGTHFPTGLLWKAVKFFQLRKIKVHQIDIRKITQRTLPLAISEEVEPREYQQEVVAKALEIDRGIMKIATGAGKTVIAASIIAQRGVSPTIFYVPSIDLLAQAKSEIEKFVRWNGSKFSVGQLGGGKKEIGDITVMTNQTAVASLGGKYVSYDDEEQKEPVSEELQQMRKNISDLIHSCKLFI
jgi:type I site-specific restriction endonuclease